MNESQFQSAVEHHRAGRLAEAAAQYRDILRSCPDHFAPNFVGSLAGLADVLFQLRQPAEALPYFVQALKHRGTDPLLHAGLADCRHLLGDLDGAIRDYEQALALNPNGETVWWGLGCARLKQKEFVRAASAFERVVSLSPDFPGGHHNLGQAMFESGQVDRAVQSLRRANGLSPNPESRGAIATIIPGDPLADNQAIFDARRDWAENNPLDGPAMKPMRDRSSPGRPLRIGYFSSFFEDRNWMKPVWGLINHHDRDRLALHLFSDTPESKIQHGYLKDSRDRFHDLSRLNNADAAQLIAEQKIDILVDLNSYSRPNRLRLFALKPAQILVAWFNAFATTGMRAFDYIIGDEYVIPPEDERFYSERVVRVPGCYLTFEVAYPVPDVAPPPCRARGAITFGCLSPQYKITNQMMEVWSRILQESPASRLVLKNRALGSPAQREFVTERFAQFGIDPSRIELDGPAEHYAFLGKYAEIDIALDTFPYNGGTTTMESLWQGVPVLSFVGDRWAGRIGASMMRNARLGEFVAADLEGHVRQAITLANNPATPVKLAELRYSMRDRLRAASVCDVKTFAQNMEAEYRRMAATADLKSC